MRLFGWFSRLIFQSVFIGGVSFLTTWMIIDLYIDKLFDQFPLEQVDARITPADLFDHLASRMGEPLLRGDDATFPNENNDSNHSNVDGNRGGNGGNYDESSRGEAAHDGAEHAEEESDPVQYVPSHGAIPVWGREHAGHDGQIDPDLEHEQERDRTDTLAMSAEEFNRKKEEMSEEDKTAVFSLLVTRVPQEVLLKMSVLLEDGLTHEELREIEEMIVEVLSEEEVEQLFEIIDKY